MSEKKNPDSVRPVEALPASGGSGQVESSRLLRPGIYAIRNPAGSFSIVGFGIPLTVETVKVSNPPTPDQAMAGRTFMLRGEIVGWNCRPFPSADAAMHALSLADGECCECGECMEDAAVTDAEIRAERELGVL